MSSLIQTISCDNTGAELSAEQLVVMLRRSHPDWWLSNSQEFEWIFRGHQDSSWRLLPSAWRERPCQSSTLAGLIGICRRMQRIRVVGHDWSSRLGLDNDPEPSQAQELAVRCASEIEALAHFAQLANSIGLPVSTVAKRPSEANQINTLCIKNAADLTPILGPMAQHHGVPTRLLDWTDDPLNAAYFAVGSDDLPLPTTDIAVWALNTRIFARHPDWYVRVFDGDRYANKFLHAQAGRFAQMLYPDSYFLKEGRWPDIEEWIKSDHVNPTNPPRPPYTESVPALRKFVLRQSEVHALRKLLHREGLNRARVMPTLENVVGELSRRWKANA